MRFLGISRMAGFKLLLGMVLVLALGACAHRDRHAWLPDYDAKRFVLPNGLTVLFVEDHSAPVVSYTTWFKVGSAWEKPGATGIAHLFEHMMFKGTPRFSAKEFHRQLERKGAMINAFTHQDATVYYEVIASQHLEAVIDMEADRLANLTLTQADLDGEREVVKEERRLRVDSDFGAQQTETLMKLAFPNHPYGWPIIGYQKDLNALTLEQCREFFKNYYQPANAIVTIAGDFDRRQVQKWIEKYYGVIKGHPVKPLELPAASGSGRELRAEIRRPVNAESLQMGYFMPSMFEADADKLSMLAWTLFGMSSSRANLKLVREKQLVLDVGAEANPKRFPFLFMVWAGMKSGVPAAAAEREIEGLIEEIKRNPPSVEELNRVKNAIRYSVINEAKSVAGVASWLASGEFYWGDYRHIFKTLAKYDKITPQDLTLMAQKYLRKENRVVVVMKPERELVRR